MLFDEVLSPKATALWSMCGKNEGFYGGNCWVWGESETKLGKLSKVLPVIILIGLARGSFGDSESSAAWSAALSFPAEMVSAWPDTKEKHILQTRRRIS